jgi:hypothetical protein
VSVVEKLLRHQAKMNKRDDFNYTALISASVAGHEKVVALLVSSGALLDLRDSTGRVACSVHYQKYEYSLFLIVKYECWNQSDQRDDLRHHI